MEQSRVRIADIADSLGLSTATVSNVIHGKTSKISDETVKRVQQELEKTGFWRMALSCHPFVGALSGLPAAAGVMVGKRLGKKDYDMAYTESKKIMYAGLIGSVIVAGLLVMMAGAYTGLYHVENNVKVLGKIRMSLSLILSMWKQKK